MGRSMNAWLALWSTSYSVRLGMVVVLAAWLMSCVSLPTSEEAVVRASQTPANYAVSGKAKVSARDLAQILRFRWQQQNGEYDIWLWGALGMGRTHLKGNEANFIITEGSQQLSGGATELMQAHFGWSVPVGALSAWLRGAMAPNMPVANKRIDTLKRLISVQQHDWNVAFADHQLVNDIWLPSRVTIRGQQVDLDLVLSWPKPVMASDSGGFN